MIVGFDYQSPEIIQEELDSLLALEPTFAQFLIYGPVPGTPFYERIIGEGRLRRKFMENKVAFYRRCTGFYNCVKHPTMTAPQVQRIQRDCFRQDFERLGPSIVRAMEGWWLGYHRLKNHANERLRACAERYRQDLVNSAPALRPGSSGRGNVLTLLLEARAAGVAELSLGADTAAYVNDGQGTRAAPLGRDLRQPGPHARQAEGAFLARRADGVVDGPHVEAGSFSTSASCPDRVPPLNV